MGLSCCIEQRNKEPSQIPKRQKEEKTIISGDHFIQNNENLYVFGH